MLNILQKIFRSNPTLETVQAIIAAQRETLFTPSYLTASTRRIDPQTASLSEIENALIDCSIYWATAYPETENDLVEWIEARCVHALYDRFSSHGTTIIDKILRRVG